MVKKKIVPREILEALMERLSNRPEFCEQISRIMDLSDPSAGGSDLNIHTLESLVKPEIQKLGRVTLKEYGEHLEEHLAEEMKQSNEVQQREKKT
jgi:hypothetical protein